VVEQLRSSGARSVLDLGCGSGALLERLLHVPGIDHVVGVDLSPSALLLAEQRLTTARGVIDERFTLRHGSMTRIADDLAGFDAAVMVETLEHLEPGELGALEHALFARLRPALVIITTPNREFNTLHGLGIDERRHPDHRFEWDRQRFEHWCTGIGRRHGFDVVFRGIGPANVWFGSSSQMAVFRQHGP
jgi:small RNA 2'-O-methyltransferase